MGRVQDSFRLDGKVAIVAGVGPTNGRQFALAMAEAEFGLSLPRQAVLDGALAAALLPD